MTWLSIGAALAGVAAIVARWLWSRRERETGRLEARLEQSEAERKRERARAKIDGDVRELSRAELERELRGDRD